MSKKTINIVLVSNGDDWEGLFVNGKCVDQHHKIRRTELVTEVLKATLKGNVTFTKKYTTYEYTEKIYEMGEFPDDISEMELED